MNTTIFIHGLESSSRGTKATWFRQHFPTMLVPDFNGPLPDRMAKLEEITAKHRDFTLIGSSFGGLMAAAFALERPRLVRRLILLAPALNFTEFAGYPASLCPVPTLIYIGRHDTVCPPQEVLPAACRRFCDLTIRQTDDDHLLRKTFPKIDWSILLAGRMTSLLPFPACPDC